MCSFCGGPLFVLGQLGRITWVQCRNCGMQFSRPIEDIDADTEDME